MKFLFTALLLVSISAQASTSTTRETKKVPVQNLDNYLVDCNAGFSGGPNDFMTTSSLSLYHLDFIFPDTNIRSVGAEDPKGRVGDHCSELKTELASLIPGEITFVRTRSQKFGNMNGVCVQFSEEDLVGTIGNFSFEGTEVFDNGQVADSNCPIPTP